MFKNIFKKKEDKIRNIEGNTFKKKADKIRSIEENMEYMASLGIPIETIINYKNTADKIKEFEKSLNR